MSALKMFNVGVEPTVPKDACIAEYNIEHYMAGRVGLEPTAYLTSRFYRPLASPNLHTRPFGPDDTI